MRVAQGGLGRFQFGEQLPCGVEFPQIAAQHGIHKPGLRPESVVFGQLDRLMDGGMIGNAVEPEYLV